MLRKQTNNRIISKIYRLVVSAHRNQHIHHIRINHIKTVLMLLIQKHFGFYAPLGEVSIWLTPVMMTSHDLTWCLFMPYTCHETLQCTDLVMKIMQALYLSCSFTMPKVLPVLHTCSPSYLPPPPKKKKKVSMPFTAKLNLFPSYEKGLTWQSEMTDSLATQKNLTISLHSQYLENLSLLTWS